ncbi:type I restriction-modification system endonuclease [Flavobacterium sp. F-65]|uniref:Type I restriction-modification system endonuclease n=1 Tax=Flavobacterium pisciphilum TaxID=2893755 RepID=A0ABS8MXQ8_9FLAO|nr:type I restriction-modification system endonuclease [Flavobacterium sp. F-65]MCC9073570.1 type I restriction-modification system endonuclease [Flavobacterium sp. F-65]
MASKFSFLQDKYPELFAISELSEKLYYLDPSSSLSKLRLFSEKMTILIWQFEDLAFFDGNQVDRINQLFYKNCIPEVIKDLLHTVRKSGNKASHDGNGTNSEAVFILKKSYQLSKWFFETYENDFLEKGDYQLHENNHNVTITALNNELDKLSKEVIDYQIKIASFNATPEIISKRKEKSNRNANNITLDEADTRKILIDKQLSEASWECDSLLINYKNNKTLPEKGKNKAIAEWPCKGKWADYALFIGTELYGIVEAKKYATDISTDLQQSKIYAELVELSPDFKTLGQWNNFKVPFLFSTNGRNYLEQIKTKSGIWFLDIRKERNKAQALRGWFSPQGIVEQYSRDVETANIRLQESDYDYLQNPNGLGLRYYQIDAIKAVEEKIIQNPEDKRSLLVMATGTGKTRTTIGFVYRMIKSDRFKRILFLTDRRLLASQALGNFKDNKVEDINTFSNIYKMEEMKSVFPEAETRLHFATVQSMVKRLFYTANEILPIDTYDCIIIDEAHRGYNLDKEINEEDLSFKDENDYVGQYKRVIEYFNAYIVGLTATPALHTTEIFGKPVHNYSYREAVIDGFLTDHEPPYIIKTKLSEEGILWEKGEKPKMLNSETNEIEELAELEDELHIEIEQFNKLVITESFNRAVIKELVQRLDPEGDEKTLIFAVRDSHADLIVQLLFEEFESIGVEVPQDTIQKLTGKVYDVENLTKRFKNEKFPNIVVTVDLLTTGIDVPQIVNLVFIRRVRSRILFEQMLGRATRLCPEIDKQFFKIYDAVRVYEALEDYTQMKTVSNPSISFQKLIEELEYIDTPERAKKQLEQIVAKLQRKKKQIDENQRDHFMYLAKGDSPEEFIENLLEIENNNIKKVLTSYTSLWDFLDKKIYQPKMQLVSEHDDQVIGIERGYGKAEKPEDYIQGFKKYIEENRNQIIALRTICTKPADLDRKSLKELKLLLDEKGYNEITLSTAWKTAKNEDLAADIISFIRTLALDTHLISHDDRIKNAINKVKNSRPWNATQLKWLDRFEKQLLVETVLTKADLDSKPFSDEGGFTKLNKIFENDLDNILSTLNENLYTA